MTLGHCLCGAVALEFDGAPNGVAHCHCDSCGRNCSAPFPTFRGLSDGKWRRTGTMPRTFHHRPGAGRMFCPTCGSPMAFRGDRWPGDIHFYAASLDDPAAVTPGLNVNWAAHLPRTALADGLPTE